MARTDPSKMTVHIECPNCGETDRARLKPKRDGERILIRCETCGKSWERHPDACPQCGERALVPQRMPLMQKARGTQQSIIGYRMARVCGNCGWSSEGPPETSAV